MRKQILLSFLGFFLLGSLSLASNPTGGHPLAVTKFRFYSQDLRLSYDPNLVGVDNAPIRTRDLLTIYGYFDRSNYSYSLRQLLHMKEELKLNDWLYFELLQEASGSIFPDDQEEVRVFFQWFMLRKSGYDAQMYFVKDAEYLHVLADKDQFGFFTIIRDGKRYINLTAREQGMNLSNDVAIIPKVPEDGSNGSFSMGLTGLPEFPESQLIYKMLEFEHKGEKHMVPVKVNKDHVKIMDDYPFSDQALYFQVGLSEAASNSLLPALAKFIQDMPVREQLECILSFTRTAFFYKEDKECYGQEKPMTAEQTLYYNFSDCEDRSALFFVLVRDLLNLPVIAVDFETHVGVAVALDFEGGDYFDYRGMRFTYCEPTGPQNTLGIGEMWDDIRQQKARILTEYLPE